MRRFFVFSTSKFWEKLWHSPCLVSPHITRVWALELTCTLEKLYINWQIKYMQTKVLFGDPRKFQITFLCRAEYCNNSYTHIHMYIYKYIYTYIYLGAGWIKPTIPQEVPTQREENNWNIINHRYQHKTAKLRISWKGIVHKIVLIIYPFALQGPCSSVDLIHVENM